MALDLYAQVQAYHALPGSGGLLDQDDEIMRLLDVVHHETQAGAGGTKGSKVLAATGKFAHLKGK